jgi:predicted metal-dependent hydrolase
VPGQAPHPRRHPDGHSSTQPEPQPELFPADQWQDSEDYLYGIDLYNFAYWWECHEVFEGLWDAAGHETEQGRLFQALIQLAAAHLKQFMGNERAAHNLLRNCARRLAGLPDFYMGVPVTRLSDNIQKSLATNQPCSLLLKLG